jgi:hypothetical protein
MESITGQISFPAADWTFKAHFVCSGKPQSVCETVVNRFLCKHRSSVGCLNLRAAEHCGLQGPASLVRSVAFHRCSWCKFSFQAWQVAGSELYTGGLFRSKKCSEQEQRQYPPAVAPKSAWMTSLSWLRQLWNWCNSVLLHFSGRTRTCCLQWTAGICFWTKWGEKAKTMPPWVISTWTMWLCGLCRSVRILPGCSKRYAPKSCPSVIADRHLPITKDREWHLKKIKEWILYPQNNTLNLIRYPYRMCVYNMSVFSM